MRNLLTRIIVALIFIPFMLYISFTGGIPFMSLVNLFILLGLCEFSFMLSNKNIHISLIMLVFFGLMIGISTYFFGERFFIMILLLGIFVSGIIQLFQNKFKDSLENLSSFLLGLIYVAVLFSYLILIREFPLRTEMEYKLGGLWIIFLFLCIWLSDTLAYFVGVPLGMHKILPGISPKKSWEGVIGGISGVILAAFLSKSLFLKEVDLIHLLVLAVLIGIFGLIGDFVESAFKRAANIKDSSNIIPGHGGILDRFDSLLFSAPLVYFYLRFILYR